MTKELLTVLYFVFFFITNLMFYSICDKIMDKRRLGRVAIYIAVSVNAIVFTWMAYGFNQLPTVTYMMVLLGAIVELVILFKNNILGILMCAFFATIYLVCVEAITISTSALVAGLTIADITHNHEVLYANIVISWFILAVISTCIFKFVPGRYIRIINQHKEQILFVMGFLLFATLYLTLNSFIYGNADTFDRVYLPVHQIITSVAWLGVVSLALVVLIRFDYLHGYKLRSEKLQMKVDEQMSELRVTRRQAERDSLVNAYNKQTTHSKITQALEDVDKGAFMIVDIDNFKNINDTKGHPFGDKVLVFLYKRIVHTVRSDDIVGRIGGDEFVVFLKDTPDVKMIENRASSLCRGVNVPFIDDAGDSVIVSISVGVALYPDHGTDFDTLYKNADKALYESKNRGKNTYSVYS